MNHKLSVLFAAIMLAFAPLAALAQIDAPGTDAASARSTRPLSSNARDTSGRAVHRFPTCTRRTTTISTARSDLRCTVAERRPGTPDKERRARSRWPSISSTPARGTSTSIQRLRIANVDVDHQEQRGARSSAARPPARWSAACSSTASERLDRCAGAGALSSPKNNRQNVHDFEQGSTVVTLQSRPSRAAASPQS